MKTTNRILAMTLCVMLTLGVLPPMTAMAEGASGPVCENHIAHDADCGYEEAILGADCTHNHDDVCGYALPTEATPCTFEHVHDSDCGYDDLDDATCAFDPASHVHDETCGYAEETPEQPCTHVHDTSCDYIEAVEAAPCGHTCALCDAPVALASAYRTNDASLLKINKLSVTLGDETGKDEKNAITATVSVPNAKKTIAVADIEATDGATVNLYDDDDFSQNEDQPVTLNGGDETLETTHIYIKVTASASNTTLYYDVTVTRVANNVPVIQGSGALSEGYQNITQYNKAISVTPGNITAWNYTGTLPNGLSFARITPAWIGIEGTPTMAGTFHFEIFAANSNGTSAPVAFSILIHPDDRTTVGFGGEEWLKVNTATEAGMLTLLAKHNNFGNTRFGASSAYSGSTLQDRMTTAADALSGDEKELIAQRNLTGTPDTYTRGTEMAGKDALEQLFWPLSVGEHEGLTQEERLSSASYWLRSPVSDRSYALYGAFGGGSAFSSDVTYDYAIRPAFHLDLTSVLFTSAAAGGKSGAAGADLSNDALAPANFYKFTSEVPTIANSFSIGSVTNSGGALTIDYSDAEYVNDEARTVSAIVKDSSDTVTYYGKLKDIESATDERGTTNVNLPDGFGSGDTLFLYVEQHNGDNFTDFASTPKEVPFEKDSTGDANDGVDFEALVGSGFYYGTYRHAAALQDGTNGVASQWFDKDGNPTNNSSAAVVQPILWRVMGEEGTGGYLTLLSEYVLNGKVFREKSSEPNANQWGASDLRKWLNDNFPRECFKTAELEGINPLEEISIKDDKGNNNNITVPGNRFYIPGIDEYSAKKVTWGVDMDSSTQLLDNIAYLKGGGSVFYWLRSPSSNVSNNALYVHTLGNVSYGNVNFAFGVRPAFQFNPSSVLFSSQIVGGAETAKGETEQDDVNYSAAKDGGENYKLTILGEDDGADVGTLTGVPGGANISLKTNEPLWLNGLKPSKTTDDGDYTVVYKIVNNSGTRGIQGYGFTGAKAVTDLKIDTAGLVDGSYTVYTWLQKNNEINSHEGTMPEYFTLTLSDSDVTYGIGLDVSGTHTFDSVVEGYSQSPDKAVVISNTGSEPPANVAVRLSGANAGSFVVSNESATGFAIAPNTGLAAGDYSATVTVTADYAEPRTFTVAFEVTPVPTHTLTVSAGTGGTVSGDSSGTYTVEAPISVIATANSGYSFSGWTATGIEVGNTPTISFNMPDKDVTLKANFTYNGGGGSGGSSSDNSSTPKTTIADKQPNMPTVAKQAVSGTVKDAVLTLHITEQMAKNAIAAAEKAAKSSGKTADGIAVAFTASNTGRYESLVALIEPGAINRLKEAGVKYVKIGSAIIDITLDTKAIAEIDKQTTGTVTVSALKQDKLSEVAKALIGSRPAFDITIKDSKGTEVSDFKDGTATIGIAYKATDSEKAGSLHAVYVDENGKPTLLAKSSYDNGRLMFGRSSLSIYGVGYQPPVPTFTDTAKHWAEDAIDFIVSRGMIDGMTATTFAPDQAITRADFLMALGKLSGADVSGYTASSFTDVKDADLSMPYIEWAVNKGIVKGIGDNKFGPEQSITRQDMAVMMQNYAKATGYTLPASRTAVTFADAGNISAYAKDAVTAIQQAGIIVGKGNNQFDPQGKATRAEASAILRRFVESVIEEGTA